MPKPLRSVLAVVAGYLAMSVAIVALTIACIKILHLQSGHPTSEYMVVNLVYSLLGALLGGWVAGRIAGYKPVQHGIALGLLILVGGIVFLMHPAPGQPLWYQWALTLIGPAMAVLGAASARRT